MAAMQGDLVQLYVYDLSNGMAQAFSQMLLGRQLEAIYHTSIVVGGMEHFFGGGINVARAGSTPFGRPMQVVDLGRTEVPEEMRAELLAELSARYTPEAYSLFHNNCNNFSDELAQLLVGRGIPPHITGLPSEVLSTPFGQMIAPMLSGMEQQLRSMRQQPAAPAAACAAPPASAPTSAHEQEAAANEPAAAAQPAAPAALAAEHEIEAAVAAGMMREARCKLRDLQLQGERDGERPSTSAAASRQPVPGMAAGGPDADEAAKLATELAVQAEYERLLATGMGAHEAQAAALEAVAVQQSLLQEQPGGAHDNKGKHPKQEHAP